MMNHKDRDIRIAHADHLRARALHDLTRAREALDLIREIAEAPAQVDSLPRIALLARGALVGATPADPAFVPGEQHDRETP
jgi:hypothetical protein